MLATNFKVSGSSLIGPLALAIHVEQVLSNKGKEFHMAPPLKKCKIPDKKDSEKGLF
jgi:hypothetical protein